MQRAKKPAPGALVVPPLSPARRRAWYALRGITPGQETRSEKIRRRELQR